MGRKNRRKKRVFKRRFGFNTKRYIGSAAQIHDMHNAAPITLDAAANSVQRTPHRGDIWFAELGDHTGTSVQRGCRPVLIISNDTANIHAETVNVLPMTRHLKKPNLPCHTLMGSAFVADTRQRIDDSMILAEQITTIGKSQLRNYAGHVEDTDLLARINHTIFAQLGLQ